MIINQKFKNDRAKKMARALLFTTNLDKIDENSKITNFEQNSKEVINIGDDEMNNFREIKIDQK